MKKHLLFAATIISIAFTTHSKRQFKPLGTVQINDTLFCDETEISNNSWKEYVFWTANIYGKNSKEHLSTLPDTLVWRDTGTFNELYVNYYYQHIAYSDYPVVGISYEQTLAYCKWRTSIVKQFLAIKKDYKYPNFEYRLPTKEEWVSFSACEYINEKNVSIRKCSYDTASNKELLFLCENADVAAPIFSREKNGFKLYNTIGNVAEMTLERGVSKGGSWFHSIEDSRPGKEIVYTKPTAWLGFRCVCVVKKNLSSS